MSCDIVQIENDIKYWTDIKEKIKLQIQELSEDLTFKRSQNGEDSVEVQDIDKSLQSAQILLSNAEKKLDDLYAKKDNCLCGGKKKTHLGRYEYGY